MTRVGFAASTSTARPHASSLPETACSIQSAGSAGVVKLCGNIRTNDEKTGVLAPQLQEQRRHRRENSLARWILAWQPGQSESIGLITDITRYPMANDDGSLGTA